MISLPYTVAMNSDGEIMDTATLKEYQTPQYHDPEVVDYTLQLHPEPDGSMAILYYGEDDTYMPDHKVKEVIEKYAYRFMEPES